MKDYFLICVEEAKKSLLTNDVPIGALIVKDGQIISYGHNTREECNNILGHAEVNAIIMASDALKNWNLNGCDLYVTLEPCSMCKEIIKQSRISNVYYLLSKPSFKKEYDRTLFAKKSSKNEQMYADILAAFFKKMR